MKHEKCRHSSSSSSSSSSGGGFNETLHGCWELPAPGRVLHNLRSQPEGLETLSERNMAKVNSSSSGCRAVVMAGKYLSSPSPPALTRGSGHRQRRMFGPQPRMMSSELAGAGGKTAASAQQEHSGFFSAKDRHVLANRNLIYRDVKAFLNEVGGDPREARYWLTQFQRATSGQSPAFAILEVRHA